MKFIDFQNIAKQDINIWSLLKGKEIYVDNRDKYIAKCFVKKNGCVYVVCGTKDGPILREIRVDHNQSLFCNINESTAKKAQMLGFENRQVFHFTKLSNLETIIKEGVLLCRNELIKRNIPFSDIANQTLVHKRCNFSLTHKKKRTLSDYVPFHFSRSQPMFHMLREKHDNAKEYVIFVLKIKDCLGGKGPAREYAYTDKHPISIAAKVYCDKQYCIRMKWHLIDENRPQLGDHKNYKMAEFLVYNKLPIDYFTVFNESYVVVYDKRTKDQLVNWMGKYRRNMAVEINPKWFQ